MNVAKKTLLYAASLLLVCVLAASQAFAQDKEKRPSPAAKSSEKVGDVTVTIDYNQPSVKGRKIWGALVPYGQVWRTGANEATTFEVDQDVKIEGQKLAKGKYALFTIPGESEWVIIFNKKAKQWGAYEYSDKEDALRVKVKPGKADKFAEMLTFVVNKNGTVEMHWENMAVKFKVGK